MPKLIEMLKKYLSIIKGPYQTTKGGQKKDELEPKESQKALLHGLIDRLCSEDGKVQAVYLAIKKGIINGTEPEFQTFKGYMSLEDMELLRAIRAGMAVHYFHPSDSMNKSPNTEAKNKFYDLAREAWEKAGEFGIAGILANNFGDEKGAETYYSLADLLK